METKWGGYKTMCFFTIIERYNISRAILKFKYYTNLNYGFLILVAESLNIK